MPKKIIIFCFLFVCLLESCIQVYPLGSGYKQLHKKAKNQIVFVGLTEDVCNLEKNDKIYFTLITVNWYLQTLT